MIFLHCNAVLFETSSSPAAAGASRGLQASPSPNRDPNWNSHAKDFNSSRPLEPLALLAGSLNPSACGGRSRGGHEEADADARGGGEKEAAIAVPVGESGGGAVRCAVCEREIAVEREHTVYRVGACGLVHDACLHCSACGRSLADDGRCFVRERDPRTLLCRADFYRCTEPQ